MKHFYRLLEQNNPIAVPFSAQRGIACCFYSLLIRIPELQPSLL